MLPRSVFYLILFVGVHCGVLDTVTPRIVEINHNHSISNATHNAAEIAPEPFISGGTQAQLNQFPWMAALIQNDLFICGGSIISKNHVLTAAHCVIDINLPHDNLAIYLGEYDRNSFPMDCVQGKCKKNIIVLPDKIVNHAQYDPKTKENDIALLKFQKEVPVGGVIQVIPLPPFDISDPIYESPDATVAGWGMTENGTISNILLTTELNLIPEARCLKIDPTVPRGHLCAGDLNGRDTCGGDSGGPLMMRYQKKYYLSGVVSYGYNIPCGKSLIGYYTNVFKYMNWIETKMKD